MKALVTGATGFVGPYLVRHLQECGDEAIGTDRSTGVDIGDQRTLGHLFSEVRPDVVYHLAGDSDVGASWEHPASTFRANAEGTLNVLMAARTAGVTRVLVVGSADVYGKVAPHELPIAESAELRPTSPYAASKVAADFLAVQAVLGYGQDVIRIRAFNHLGPGQSQRFVAPAIAQRIVDNELTGSRSVPVGNLTPERDITDVRDVVRAYRLLAQHGVAGEVYNVCSGRSVPVRHIADQLLELTPFTMTLSTDPKLIRPVDIPILTGDNSRLVAATGWQPTVPLDVTLSDLITHLRERSARAQGDPSMSAADLITRD